jgi:hypothetical protein
VAGDRLHVLDAICICQQVLRSPLPKDKKEWERKMGGANPRGLLAFLARGLRRAVQFEEDED